MVTRTSAAPKPGILRQEISLSPDATEAAAPQEAQSFWERIFAIDAEEWASKYFCYLYRGKVSLEKITHAFDQDWVKQKYGGGEYRALLNDERYKMVAAHNFSIDGPPKAQPSEAQTIAPAAPSQDAFQAQVLNLIRENNQQIQSLLRDIMTERRPAPAYSEGAPNPVDPNVALKGVVDMLTAMVPKQQDPLELLVKLQTLAPKPPDLLELLIKAKQAGLIPDGAAAGGSLLDQIDKVTEVASKLGFTAGGGKSMGEILLEKGPEIVKGVAEVIDRYKAVEETRLRTATTVASIQRTGQPAAAAQPGVQPAAPGATPPPQQIPPLTSGLDVEPVGTTVAPHMPAPAAAVMEMTEADLVKSRIVQAIANGAGGGDIVSFLGVMNEAMLDTFRGVTVTDLETFCAMDPILKGAMQLPRFKDCLREIVEVLQEEEGAEVLPN